MQSNGTADLGRAEEISEIISKLQELIVPFIQTADEDTRVISSGQGLTIPVSTPDSLHFSHHNPQITSISNGVTDPASLPQRPALVEAHPPPKLTSILNLSLPTTGTGTPGLLSLARLILSYSVNTFSPGFLDKLYAATNAPGIASELLLASLNTNLHVAHVSPALTEVERTTSFALARLIGWDRDVVDAEGNRPFRYAGGVAQNGGSASNHLALLIARATLFPATKEEGNGATPGGKRLVAFTSEHGHYSLEKACVIAGLGSGAAVKVKVDERGRMIVEELRRGIRAARERGELPFFVNATAGTTVYGSFDPVGEIAKVAKAEGLWCHVDGSWGGPVLFSPKLRKGRLDGIENVDTMVISPHKMLGVPCTSSFLIGKDLRLFKSASTIKASYLFHNDESGEFYDLADLTPQCGRKGDALKLFLGWNYYGTAGYAKLLEEAFDVADHFHDLLAERKDFVLVSEKPLPCLQVCFYWAKDGQLKDKEYNGKLNSEIVRRLVARGFMVDYAPGPHGKLIRAVVARDTKKSTVEGLVKAIEAVAKDIEI